jgi:hypothetical protein
MCVDVYPRNTVVASVDMQGGKMTRHHLREVDV